MRLHGQKGFHRRFAQFTGVTTKAMKPDEPVRPVQIVLLRAQSVVQLADTLTPLIQQT